jgi:hypothetical protein
MPSCIILFGCAFLSPPPLHPRQPRGLALYPIVRTRSRDSTHPCTIVLAGIPDLAGEEIQRNLEATELRGTIPARSAKHHFGLYLFGSVQLCPGFRVILQTPRMVPGLPEVRSLPPRLVEQTVSGVQQFQELGKIVGRSLFVFLVVRIPTQRLILRVFLVPGLIVFSCVYFLP